MKKSVFTAIFFFAFIQVSVFAQTKDIDAGVSAYEGGKYEEAISLLDQGLSDPGKLKEKYLLKGYYYRGRAKVDLIKKTDLNKVAYDEIAGKLKEDVISSVEDLKLAQKYDTENKMKADIKISMGFAEDILIDMARISFNEGKNTSNSKDKMMAFMNDANDLADAAVAVNDRNYVTFVLKGEVYKIIGDDANALKSYNSAGEVFFYSAPKTGDLNVAKIYINIAELERDFNKDKVAAQKAIDQGKRKLDGENLKIQKLGSSRPTQLAEMEKKYNTLKEELEAVEKTLK